MRILILFISSVVFVSVGIIWIFPKIALIQTPLVDLAVIETAVEDGRLDQAIAYCKKRISQYPEEIASYELLGSILEEKSKYKEAIKIYDRISERFPEDGFNYLCLGRIYYKQNEIESAVEHLRYAESLLQKAQDKENLAQARGLLASIYIEFTKEYNKAILVSQRAVADNPQDWDARYQLGTAYAYSNQSQSAYREFNKIVQENPGTEIAQYAENAIQYVREKRNPQKSKYLSI
jgi:tetratricopeptide (TPR) repeat protein